MKVDATNPNTIGHVIALSKTVFESTSNSIPIDHTCFDTTILLKDTEDKNHAPYLHDKWNTSDGQREDVEAVYAIRKHLLEFYVKHFDESKTYIQSAIILGPYLDHLITSIMSRRRRLNEINWHSEEIFFKASSRKNFEFRQLRDFTRAIETEEFSEQIYIDLIDLELPKATILTLTTDGYKRKRHSKNKKKVGIKLWLKKGIIKAYNRLVLNRAHIVISSPHIGTKDLAKIFIRSKFKISMFPSDDIFDEFISKFIFPTRKHREVVESKSESKFLIYELLFIKYLPACYGKISALGESVMREFNLPARPESIFTANSYQYNEAFKAYLVLTSNSSRTLHIAQHGGHYGMGEFNLTEKHEREIADFYWTWGWKDSYYPGATILPAGMIKPKLPRRQKNRRRNSRIELLLVGLSIPKHPYRFYSTPMGVGVLNQYLFLKHMFRDLATETVKINYRLSPDSRGFNQTAIADWMLCDHNFVVTPGDYVSDIKESDLVLCINNGTNFLEVLNSNKPCLWLLDQTQWGFRQSTCHLMSRLADANIVHTDPKKAAEFINSLNLDDWWTSEAVQSIRDEFCSVFAAESPDFTRLFVERVT